jgi:HlyD family secretion protein
MKRRRIFIIIGIVIVLAVVAAVVIGRGSRNQSGETENAETLTAFIGDLSASATASGQVQPRRSANLTADLPGRVEEVRVRIGDTVTAGDVLLQLDTTDLALNVAVAEQNLKLQEANLAGLVEEPGAADITAAEAAVASAQAQLDDLLAGPGAEELAAREADLRAAEASVLSSSYQLRQTQNAVKEADIAAAEAALAAAKAGLLSVEIQYTRNPDPEDIQANTALAQAREQVASAQAQLDDLLAGPDQNQVGSAQASLSATSAQRDATEAQLNKINSGPSAAEVAGAEAQLAQARASLAALLRGPEEEQITSAEAEVERARLALLDAQAALESATITAPFDGLVTAVHVSEGEIAAGPLVDVVDRDSLEIVLEVDEVDVGALAVGQPAVVTLESWPDTELQGEITAISPRSMTVPGSALVIYEVHLGLADSDLPILIGMTADADLVTAEKEDILLVPNQAINADRSNGTYSVNVVVGDEIEEVPVTIGLRDGRYTQITSGLNAGDELFIGSASPVFEFGSGPPGGGGGGGFGG